MKRRFRRRRTGPSSKGLAFATAAAVGLLILTKGRSASAAPEEDEAVRHPVEPDSSTPEPFYGAYVPSGPVRGNPTTFEYQDKLSLLGYDPGPIDGKMGDLTRNAIGDFQVDHRLATTRSFDSATKAAINADLQKIGYGTEGLQAPRGSKVGAHGARRY